MTPGSGSSGKIRWTKKTVYRCLQNLAEIYAVALSGDGKDDTPERAKQRAEIAVMRADLARAFADPDFKPMRKLIRLLFGKKRLSQRETAKKLGLSRQVVRKRLEQAIQHILTFLEGKS